MANIIGNLIVESTTTGDKIVYTITLDQANYKANLLLQFYEKGAKYAGIDNCYVLVNDEPIIINNPYYPTGVQSNNYVLVGSANTELNYKKDGTLDLELAMTYKGRGPYPNVNFNDEGYRISWINDTKTKVNIPCIPSTKYKKNNIWYKCNAWLKTLLGWKHCIVWKKIDGVWKRGK